MKLKLFITAIVAVAAFSPGHAGSKAKNDCNITINDVWTAYDAFNNVYLDTDKNIYKNTDRDKAAIGRDRGAAAIWCQPMYVDMAINAVELAKKSGDKKREEKYSTLLNNLLEGNIAHYLNFDFDDADLNRGWFIYDDIQWWTITMARAYLATGNEKYRRLAEKSFARVWYGSPRVGDTGSYADPAKGLGGGMFWQWQPIDKARPNEAGHGKMSWINFPTVVAAMLLYQSAPADRKADPEPEKWTNAYGSFTRPAYETKQRYLEMAKEIYAWSAEHLADHNHPGKIFDSRHGENSVGHPLIYNQGTFIGASTLLYLETGDKKYLKNAINGADYSINVMSAEHGLLPWAHNPNDPYHQGSLEQGVYPAIWTEYMKLLINDCGQHQYIPFMLRNIETGWKNRDKARNICDGESWKPTTADRMIGSYAASSIPALMLTNIHPSTNK